MIRLHRKTLFALWWASIWGFFSYSLWDCNQILEIVLWWWLWAWCWYYIAQALLWNNNSIANYEGFPKRSDYSSAEEYDFAVSIWHMAKNRSEQAFNIMWKDPMEG